MRLVVGYQNTPSRGWGFHRVLHEFRLFSGADSVGNLPGIGCRSQGTSGTCSIGPAVCMRSSPQPRDAPLNTEFRAYRSALPYVAVAAILSLTGAACGRNPFEVRWEETKLDTAVVYSLARPELNLPTAFDFIGGRSLRIEAPGSTGAWDLALDTQGGQLVFLPPGALGIESEAGIVPFPGLRFDELTAAPGDTALYKGDEPIPLDAGSVYVIRTHRSPDRFGIRCVFYAKLEPLAIEPTLGTLQFRYDVNPLCGERQLVPTPDG